MRVFIADDSHLVRERLVALISELDGVELVGQAADGRAALAALRRLKPDVAILDLRMPRYNGLQTLKALRRDERKPVLIVLTAFPHAPYQKMCLAAGADYFFDKSTEFEQVVHVLERLRNALTQSSRKGCQRQSQTEY